MRALEVLTRFLKVCCATVIRKLSLAGLGMVHPIRLGILVWPGILGIDSPGIIQMVS